MQLPEAPQQPSEHRSQQTQAQSLRVWADRLVVSAVVDSARTMMLNTTCNFDFIRFSSECR